MKLIEETKRRWGTDGTHYDGFYFPSGDWFLSSLVTARGQIVFKNVCINGNLIVGKLGPDGTPINCPVTISLEHVDGEIRFIDYWNDHHTTLTCKTLTGDFRMRGGRVGPLSIEVDSRGNFICEAVEHTKTVKYAGSKIVGDMRLNSCTYRGEVDFIDCEIGGNLNLEDITFPAHTDLSGCRASGYNLKRTKFHRGVDFCDCNVGERDENVLSREDIKDPIYFENANISKLLVTVENAEQLRGIRFAHAIWHRRRKFWELPFSPHFHQFAKFNLEDQVRLMRIYRQRFEEDFRSREAGLFYIREMELQKHLERKWSLGWFINSLYCAVSRYGESIFRPIAWILVVLATASLIIYAGGVTTASDSRGVLGGNLSFLPGTPFFLDSDYWECLQININLLAPLRSRTEDHLNQMWQRTVVNVEAIAVLTLLSFLIVALRRRFRQRH